MNERTNCEDQVLRNEPTTVSKHKPIDPIVRVDFPFFPFVGFQCFLSFVGVHDRDCWCLSLCACLFVEVVMFRWDWLSRRIAHNGDVLPKTTPRPVTNGWFSHNTPNSTQLNSARPNPTRLYPTQPTNNNTVESTQSLDDGLYLDHFID